MSETQDQLKQKLSHYEQLSTQLQITDEQTSELFMALQNAIWITNSQIKEDN